MKTQVIALEDVALSREERNAWIRARALFEYRAEFMAFAKRIQKSAGYPDGFWTLVYHEKVALGASK
jgi:hypothetical protein